ncbi:MAG: hypothetical protein ACWGOV_08455 [Acidiferrobacterales bacterium]
MDKSRLTILVLFVTLIVVGCTRTSDEDLIKQNLDQAIDAVKARQPKAVVKHLTQDFVGQEQMSSEDVRRFMIAQFFRNQKINIVTTGLSITVDNAQQAHANFRVVVTGGVDWIPERLDYYQVETDWVKQDGDWLIRAAKWKPVLVSS